MPYKDPEKQKFAQHQSYLRNKEAILDRQKERRPSIRQNAMERRIEMCLWVNSLKKETPCSDCRRIFPTWACDFHHIDPSTKVGGVRHMASVGYSKETILAEMDKCEYLCAICHRGRHNDPAWRAQYNAD